MKEDDTFSDLDDYQACMGDDRYLTTILYYVSKAKRLNISIW